MMESNSACGSLPRVRGGVPMASDWLGDLARSSPRTRGCSPFGCHAVARRRVFPAYAGVFLKQHRKSWGAYGLPRVRGGVPNIRVGIYGGMTSSPRTRGCSPGAWWFVSAGFVFPAYAGVFPASGSGSTPPTGLPRVRGGVPDSSAQPPRSVRSSPRTRGCSRGVVYMPASASSLSSPRTRGCSPIRPLPPSWTRVFPAYAGVFPRSRPASGTASGLPRVRGGVPERSMVSDRPPQSPRTRGCSQVAQRL